MSKNGHIGLSYSPKYIQLYYPSFQELLHHSQYEHILKLRIIIHVLQNIYQRHNPTFFLKAASSERGLPEHSLYLKEGSHDGVSNAQ